MAIVYTRVVTPPQYSFFLFGPRGTGKTTWLRQQFPDALWFNLLKDTDYVPLLGNASLFRAQVEQRPPHTWIVVDEVQKLPPLLDAIHDLISLHAKKYLFALSGSSARKPRRANVNLLAGRVIDRRMFPFTRRELAVDFALDQALTFGCLPAVCVDRAYAADILESYVGSYLREEIQQEALVENLDSFGRFLKVAAALNGAVLNTSNVARECGVARKTVERYFQTLIDTLIGFSLPAWQPRFKVREISRPKFYLFDCGVVRALTGKVRVPVHDSEKGRLLETYLLHELRAALSYRPSGGKLGYYAGTKEESDVIVSIGDRHVGVEIKAGTRWRGEYARTLKALVAAGKIERAYGVYQGDRELRDDCLEVLPVERFLDRLWGEGLIPA